MSRLCGNFIPAFLFLQDTKNDVNGMIAFLANIGLNLILVHPMAHGGLALTPPRSVIHYPVMYFSGRTAKKSARS